MSAPILTITLDRAFGPVVEGEAVVSAVSGRLASITTIRPMTSTTMPAMR